MGYAFGTIDELGDGVFRKVRRELGVTAFGVNVVVLEPGVVGLHRHYTITGRQLGTWLQAGTAPWDVVGPVCESGDFLAKDRSLPEVKPGDLLAVMSAGAYGFVMASNYNSRPRVPEVLVKDNEVHVVRARESYDDLVRGETIPAFLS